MVVELDPSYIPCCYEALETVSWKDYTDSVAYLPVPVQNLSVAGLSFLGCKAIRSDMPALYCGCVCVGTTCFIVLRNNSADGIAMRIFGAQEAMNSDRKAHVHYLTK